jgi:hypothetical protein
MQLGQEHKASSKHHESVHERLLKRDYEYLLERNSKTTQGEIEMV